MALPSIPALNSGQENGYLPAGAAYGERGVVSLSIFHTKPRTYITYTVRKYSPNVKPFFWVLFLVAFDCEWTSTLVAGWQCNELEQA